MEAAKVYKRGAMHIPVKLRNSPHLTRAAIHNNLSYGPLCVVLRRATKRWKSLVPSFV
jgi:hypothetical protein